MQARNLLIVLSLAMASPLLAQGALKPDKVHVADARKTQAYIKDGLVVGGDQAIDDVVVRDIRRAANAGYERIVIDLEGNKGGEPAAIQRPPYYQLAVSPEEKRLVFTVFGKPKLAFDARKVLQAFKKSAIVGSVELLPRLEEDSWTFVLGLRATEPVEVFELSNPVRVILDIKSDRAHAAVGTHQALHARRRPHKRALPRTLPPQHPVDAQGVAPDHGGAIDAPPESGAPEQHDAPPAGGAETPAEGG